MLIFGGNFALQTYEKSLYQPNKNRKNQHINSNFDLIGIISQKASKIYRDHKSNKFTCQLQI